MDIFKIPTVERKEENRNSTSFDRIISQFSERMCAESYFFYFWYMSLFITFLDDLDGVKLVQALFNVRITVFLGGRYKQGQTGHGIRAYY